MIANRAHFLGTGHYAPLANAVSDPAAHLAQQGLILEVGAGTAYYLARCRDHLAGRYVIGG